MEIPEIGGIGWKPNPLREGGRERNFAKEKIASIQSLPIFQFVIMDETPYCNLLSHSFTSN